MHNFRLFKASVYLRSLSSSGESIKDDELMLAFKDWESCN